MNKFFTIFVFQFFIISNVFAGNSISKIEKAENEIENGNYSSAEKLLTELVVYADNNEVLANSYFLLSQITETLAEANQYLEKIVDLKNNEFTTIANFHLAKNYYCESKYEKAEKYFTKFLKYPKEEFVEDAIFWNAQNYFCLKNYSMSQKYFQKYLEIGNENSKIEIAKLSIGTAYFRMKNFSAALKILTDLKNSDSEKNFLPKLLLTIGFCHENLSQFEKSIEFYKKVINQFPYSEERYLAETRLVSLAEKGIYKSSLKIPATEVDAEKKYIIQLAAFQEKTKATSSQKKYKTDGYDAFIYEKFVNNKIYFAVGIGPFKTFSEAKNIQNTLDENSKKSSFIYEKP